MQCSPTTFIRTSFLFPPAVSFHRPPPKPLPFTPLKTLFIQLGQCKQAMGIMGPGSGGVGRGPGPGPQGRPSAGTLGGGGGGWTGSLREGGFFLALEGVPPRPEPEFSIFGQGSRELGGVPWGRRSRDSGRVLGCSCQMELAIQALRALFDHSPMAPPIVHPVKVCLAARYSSGSRHPSKGWVRPKQAGWEFRVPCNINPKSENPLRQSELSPRP